VIGTALQRLRYEMTDSLVAPKATSGHGLLAGGDENGVELHGEAPSVSGGWHVLGRLRQVWNNDNVLLYLNYCKSISAQIQRIKHRDFP
jgi:hypothetical protein